MGLGLYVTAMHTIFEGVQKQGFVRLLFEGDEIAPRGRNPTMGIWKKTSPVVCDTVPLYGVPFAEINRIALIH